ncbi:hypothetical protein NELON_05265 [Neisseria elongata subsp. glycolytica ATCC 29315]|uniref:Uncharacterized protein n=1 Tax=Neisseria elongata subsp. glycolytica ATCC 29315 TaxID=546263 RepID=A0A0B5CQ87_NEIEG|nr:hypothetical protein NELON_05265 [Neisseria elongata subsp. glycolytica ATCC 29315]
MNNMVEKVFQTLNYKNWLTTRRVFLEQFMISLYLMKEWKHGRMAPLFLIFIMNINVMAAT